MKVLDVSVKEEVLDACVRGKTTEIVLRDYISSRIVYAQELVYEDEEVVTYKKVPKDYRFIFLRSGKRQAMFDYGGMIIGKQAVLMLGSLLFSRDV